MSNKTNLGPGSTIGRNDDGSARIDSLSPTGSAVRFHPDGHDPHGIYSTEPDWGMEDDFTWWGLAVFIAGVGLLAILAFLALPFITSYSWAKEKFQKERNTGHSQPGMRAWWNRHKWWAAPAFFVGFLPLAYFVGYHILLRHFYPTAWEVIQNFSMF